MPEGPSIVILKEEVAAFKGKKVLHVSGNSKLAIQQLKNKKVKDFKSWGKHFLICFQDITVRIHFMLFGSYRISDPKSTSPRLQLDFSNGTLSFYACSIKLLEEDPDTIYDWTADVMNPHWSASKAKEKLKAQPDMLVCDALLDQNIFSGVGNIIKNEVAFRIRVHPESKVGKLPARKLTAMIKEARQYSFDFLHWKKAFELKKHWLVHTKKTCPRCHTPLIKKYLGKTHRRTFFCNNCQILYK